MLSTTLLADSGSTKTQWRVIDAQGETLDEFFTGGLNPSLMPAAEVDATINSSLRKRRISPSRVYYYGAGCTPERVYIVEHALKRLYPQADVFVGSDLVAAVRALCGDDEGVACILGTGMASCMCKGGEVVRQTPSLGYVLGDEGSGAVLGKKFHGALLKGAFPESVSKAWQEEYGLSVAEIIGRVYREPQPNRFLASFVPFIAKHLAVEPVRTMVVEEFRLFFRRNIVPYGNPALPVNFVGGVAANFTDELREAAEQEGFKVGIVLQAPMDNLAQYHRQH